MLKNLLKNSKLANEIGDFKKSNERILDIIVFGSVVRGKRKPNDIDILLLLSEKGSLDLSHDLSKIFKKYDLEAEITDITYNEIFDTGFLPRESILSEGYSLVEGKSLSESFGFETFIVFIYSQRGFSKTKRMKFHYALNGRGNNSGMMTELDLIKITDGTLLCPVEKSEELKEFLELWEVSFKSFDILVPMRTVEYKEFKL